MIPVLLENNGEFTLYRAELSRDASSSSYCQGVLLLDGEVWDGISIAAADLWHIVIFAPGMLDDALEIAKHIRRAGGSVGVWVMSGE